MTHDRLAPICETLWANAFRSARPGLAQVRRRLDAIVERRAYVQLEPRRAWELLHRRGAIGRGWFAAPHRSFQSRRVCTGCRGAGTDADGWGCSECRGDGDFEQLQPHPPSALACANAAARIGDLARAEELAREVARRLADWSVAPVKRFEWRLEPSARPQRARRLLWLAGVPDPLHDAMMRERARFAVARGDEGIATVWDRAPRRSAWPFDWPEQLAGLVYGRWLYAHLGGTGRFARANPFEPLLSLWELGVVMSSAHRGTAALIAFGAELPLDT